MKIHFLKHVPFEGPAHIALWAARKGHRITVTELWDGQNPPPMSDWDILGVLGGPMGADDEGKYPWMAPEKTYLEKAVSKGKTIFGLCLGAQLLARVLGGKVYRAAQREIGWLPVELTIDGKNSRYMKGLDPVQKPFQWHGDTFDIPSGALHLARSEAVPNQAFSFEDRILALQYHLEANLDAVNALITNCPEDLATPGPYVMNETLLRNPGDGVIEKANTLMESIMEEMAVKAGGK